MFIIGEQGEGPCEAWTACVPCRLRHRWYWPEPNWSAWHDMSLPPGSATAIAAGSMGENHQEVAVAVGDTVHHRWWKRQESDWSDWHAMPLPGSEPVTGIAAGSYADGHQELFAIVGGEIRHRWYWADTNWLAGLLLP